MKTVIYRIYHSHEGVRKFLQGKIFRPEKYAFDIYYRDIYPKRSTLWKTKYEKPESQSYNIDHLVFDYLLKQEVKEIHYYIAPKRYLLRVETLRVDKHLKLGNVKKEMLNNHTQLFIPESLFRKTRRDYSVPWINTEISINDLLKEKNEELANSKMIPDEVKVKLYQKIKSEPKLVQQLSFL